ncbi:hypothetical protein TIFTF001_018958 [Ficus carica]|uniref:Protein kinase domain-containing protein n=1 Tax=Ficus carica TaxID=3494 RepID=A0AA88DC67_FICCA|nr:hypothetical protein TIFTF001_018958 [Ficus carica]
MNPKISDFGMAKIFCMDQSQGHTSRVIGTLHLQNLTIASFYWLHISRVRNARCIQVGLLFVQEDPADRPDRPEMPVVAFMLRNLHVNLPLPKQPPLFLHYKRTRGMHRNEGARV